MSRFITRIPTEVQAIIDALPKGSYVHAIALDKDTNEVLINWEQTRFESGLTVPVEFSLLEVKTKKLPRGVKDITKKQPAPPTPPPVTDAPTVILEPAKPAPDYLTQEQVESLSAKGTAIEFMGIRPEWLRFNPKQDTFTAGYFYRIVEKPLDIIP
jgi:hypothetical protein